MKKLTDEEVLHVADLARLYLTDEEIDKFSYQLRSLLDNIDKINNLKINDCEPLIAPYTNDCILREDKSYKSDENYIENAPYKFDNFIKVAGVFDE